MNTQNTTTKAMETPEKFSELDADTRRSVTAILANGYYETYTSLGVGGWPAVYKFAQDWKTYVLFATHEENEFEDTIIAKDDQTALRAFNAKYRLADCDFVQIREKIVTYRQI